MSRALEGVEDDTEAGRRDIAVLDIGPRNVVLGIAASGRTPYVLRAIAEARSRGAVACFEKCLPAPTVADYHQNIMSAHQHYTWRPSHAIIFGTGNRLSA